MQTEIIVLIPPTHEQSVYTFHVEKSLFDEFLPFLRNKGIVPWRPPASLPKEGPDGLEVMQIEFETGLKEPQLKALAEEFLEFLGLAKKDAVV